MTLFRHRSWREVGAYLFRIALLTASVLARAQSPDVVVEFTRATQDMREGKLEDAEAGFAAIVRKTPGFAEGHFNLALVQEKRGRHGEAIASFQRALTLKPQLHHANLFLGMAEFRLHDLDSALAAVKREIAKYPNDAAAWMWLGVVRLAQERPEEAAEALDRAFKLNPNDEGIQYHRGRAHLLVSKDSYSRMFKIDPNSWLVHRVLAQANAEAERHVDAIAEYEAAIKLSPREPGLHEELGSEYASVNKIAEAEAAFQQELGINPHNLIATYKLGTIEIEKRNGTKAKQLIEAAQRENPGLVHLDYNLGRAEMLLGNDVAAAIHFERAVKTDKDPEVIELAWYQLGTAYRHLSRMDEARNAIATYQQLKEEGAKKLQRDLEDFRVKHPNDPESSPLQQYPK